MGSARASGGSHASASALTTGISFEKDPSGRWSAKRAEHELALTEQAHQQRIALDNAEHERVEDTNDRRHRRQQELLLLRAVIVGLALVLTLGFLLSIFGDGNGNRELGRGIVLTVISGVVGYAIGGKRS